MDFRKYSFINSTQNSPKNKFHFYVFSQEMIDAR